LQPPIAAPSREKREANMAKRVRRKRKKARRTVLYSAKGRKLYAKRDNKGRFKDIQSYKRSHRADMKRKSKKEK
jgi:hypothetical protein